jgi:Protein of unknown function (DUF1800)
MATPAAPGKTLTTDDAIRHLIRRTTYGHTAGLFAEVKAAGAGAWLESQLSPSGIKDPVGDDLLSRFPTQGWSIGTVTSKIRSDQIQDWDAMEQLGILAVARAIWSKRQLLEVMVDFWSNLLNVTNPSSEVSTSRAHYDRAVIRSHAFGSYREMLHAAITHPAMLRYLNNASSSKDDPNENLGRELLELHSVGVSGGYTETDVKVSARILTGLSVDWDTEEFRYRPDTHHVGPVRVMGFSHANGSADGRGVVAAYTDYLARHPATANRLARRLAVHFVSDDPPPALVLRLADTYLANDTAIVPVLRRLFTSAEFAASVDAKVRRPFEAMVASVRARGLPPPAKGIQTLRQFYWLSNDLGHCPLAWPMPNGYPYRADEWRSASGTLHRWNINLGLAGGWWPTGLTYPPVQKLLPKPLPASHGDLITAVGWKLRGRAVTAKERDAVCAYLGVRPGTRLTARSEAVTWRLRDVVGLLLDSPNQMLR